MPRWGVIAGVVGGLAVLGGGAVYAIHRSRRADEADEEEGWISSLVQTGVMVSQDVALLSATEQAAKIPGLARYLAAVGAGESNWKSPTRWRARNDSKGETAASLAAVKGGLERGLPPLNFAEFAAGFGSGGMFGILAPYGLWSGRPDYPLVEKPPDVIFIPEVSCAIAADMVVRNRKRGVKTWWQMRVAWKSLKVALEDPGLLSDTSRAVLGRMAKRTAEQGLQQPENTPIETDDYPGMATLLDLLGYGGQFA